MNVYHIDSFKNGWFLGNFNPSVLQTENFEVSYMKHYEGQKWPRHYHLIACEINVLMKGRMIIHLNDHSVNLNPGDIFKINPGEIVKPEFLEDCELIVIKIPSVIGDKYEI